MLESLFDKSVMSLVEVKLRNNLRAYRNEIKRIRDFSNKIIRICEETYPLKVVLLEKISESEYIVSIKIPL